MIRSVPANASDALYCMMLAQNAVHGAMAGYTGFSVGLVNNRVVYIPIPRMVATSPRIMDPSGGSPSLLHYILSLLHSSLNLFWFTPSFFPSFSSNSFWFTHSFSLGRTWERVRAVTRQPPTNPSLSATLHAAKYSGAGVHDKLSC